ncbi:polysaccharide pyruvyl transferase family protein [Paludibacterium yongneupense]|uniref:polysaccharide pyruvyl transferase family protein n=1 Tax=Paludibacterium yongneupense TaxID=400061 RepID=UPI0004075FAE|nr:polysaccharide pyruvyl transferase family protein [Paludibacterium yongneupense]
MKNDDEKFGIVTYHDGFNFGAYLQVYALQQVMARNGFASEIINYKGSVHWWNEYRSLLWTKRPILLAKNILKLFAFKAAHKKLCMSRFSKKASDFDSSAYRSVVYGSDEIWNYSNPLLGFDPFYFGTGFEKTRKIAYAPSCGNLSRDAVVPDAVAKGWKSFDEVAVRDINSQAILSKYRSTEPGIVLDPTFLYDFDADTRPCKDKDFILVYTTGFSKAEEKSIREYADTNKLKLISIGYLNKFCDKNVIGVGPFEFLGYYAAATHVVTSMFHGTIFSIKFKKNFALFVDPYRTNKLEYILTRFLLQNRVTDNVGLASVLGRRIDYDAVGVRLKEDVEFSRSYLLNALAKE